MRQDYRLLVLDLDGTLTNSKKEISPRNLRTLLHLQQSGIGLRPPHLRHRSFGGTVKDERLHYSGVHAATRCRKP